MGAGEIRAYLSHLAVARRVAASTQIVGFSTPSFLYREVLLFELLTMENEEAPSLAGFGMHQQ
jgi:hypothetical protein